MISFPRRGLYALVDTGTLRRRGISPLVFADAVLAGGPAVLQLRAKDASDDEVRALLRALAPRARAAGVLLFANDRPDLAAAEGVPGVHVGQGDAPVSEVRARFPELLVGVSTHDEAQLARAVVDAPDYVAFGPVFATSTKRDAEPVVGLDRLRAARAATDVPLVAIGGLDEARAPLVAEAGALVAVVSALVPENPTPQRITEATRRIALLAGTSP